MKKTIRLTAALLALSLSLAGCGGAAPAKKTENKGKTSISVAAKETTAPEKTGTKGKAVAQAKPAGKAETPGKAQSSGKTPSKSKAAEEKKKDAAGRIENGVYINEYLGIRFDAGDWTLQGASELQDNQAVEELLEGTKAGELMDSVEQFTDMQAVSADQTMNVNVVYTKMTALDAARYAKMDEDAIIQDSLDNKEMLMEVYESAGVTVESLEKCSVFFGGRDRVGMKLVGSMLDIPIYMVQVFDCKQGNFNVAITITSMMEDQTAEGAAKFEALEN